MKNFALYCLVAALSLASLARADVCQKNSTMKIHNSLLPSGNLRIETCYTDTGKCLAVASAPAYRLSDLQKARDGYNLAARGAEAVNFVSGIFALLQIVAVAQAAKENPLALQLAARNGDLPPLPSVKPDDISAENGFVLKDDFLKVTNECVYVGSIMRHREVLKRVLDKFDAEKLAEDMRKLGEYRDPFKPDPSVRKPSSNKPPKKQDTK